LTTYRLDLAYDGTGFSGWALQPGRRTVQGELEAALQQLFGERIGLTVAGRTDAGVHALAQVASFATFREPPDDLAYSLNAVTGPDVAIASATEVGDGFNARRDARSRRYRYRLEMGWPPSPFERGRALNWRHRFDRPAVEECAAALVGVHDFTAFTPTDSEHSQFERRVVAAEWSEESERILRFEIEADAFMRSMVRSIVGTLLEVASGRRSVEGFRELLRGAARSEAGDTAAARGLYLIAVDY